MTSKKALLIGSLLVALAQMTIGAPLVEYEWDSTNYMPSTQGWTENGSGVFTNDTVNGALDIASTNGNNPWFSSLVSTAALADPSGWTLTGRLSVQHADTTNWAVSLAVDTGSHFLNLMFYNNYLNPAMSGVHTHSTSGITMLKYIPDINTTFHTFQMIYDPSSGNPPELYVDGTSWPEAGLYAQDGGTFLPAGTVCWGSFNGAATSNVKWQSVSFETGIHPVPEPVTMLLLSTGGLSLVRRRK